MKAIVSALLVIFAVYLFFTMIASIDFSGMNFSDIKLIISICAGIAVAVVSTAKGMHIIVSAIEGFVVGAILYAFILFAIENIF